MSDLKVRWSKREGALLYTADGPTGGLVSYHFEGTPTTQGTSLIKELESRGFDITTLRFSVRKREVKLCKAAVKGQ